MLGYNTQRTPSEYAPTYVLITFQNQYGFTPAYTLTAAMLAKMDELLAAREQEIVEPASRFILLNHMKQQHPHDVTKDWVALLFGLPMSVLPEAFQLDEREMVHCVAGQCYGSIQDQPQGGADMSFSAGHPIDITEPYYFAGGYADSGAQISQLPSAAVNVETMLHEFAHELDGKVMAYGPYESQPHAGAINTTSFYDIFLNMGSWSSVTGCAPQRSTDILDYISAYGFNPGYYGCSPGYSGGAEEFAEAFQIYVTSGRNFRAAAQARALQGSTLLRDQYDWLKQNVFDGREFDTDLQQGTHSGCNTQPAYVSCSNSYVWDGTLPTAVPTP